MFTLDKKELLKLPRIALIYGDGEYASWKEPIKRSFEIPTTMFADVHASRVKEAFLDKRSQFLLCIVSPGASAQQGADLGEHAGLWVDYLNQGGFLMLFDAETTWLGKLGQRFAVAPRAMDRASIAAIKPRGIRLESRLLANQGCAEGIENLGPWIGEYAGWDPSWEVLAESESGGALGLAQSFGMSKIILFTGLLAKDNLIKIIPVRMLIASASETWFRETAASMYDMKSGLHCSVTLNRKIHVSFLPLICSVNIGSIGNRRIGGHLDIEIQVTRGAETCYRKEYPPKELINGTTLVDNLTIDLSSINDHPIEDGDYSLKAMVSLSDESGKHIQLSEEIEFSVNTREISEIWGELHRMRLATAQELGQLRGAFEGQDANGDPEHQEAVIANASRGMGLVYLLSRIGICYEILENVLGEAVDPGTPFKVKGKITAPVHVNIGAIAELRRVYDECLARMACVPGFTAKVAINARYRLLQALTSRAGSGCVWECKPVSGASAFIQGFGNKTPQESMAIFHNGFCVASASCVVEGKEVKLQKYMGAFKEQHPECEEIGHLGLLVCGSFNHQNAVWHGIMRKDDFVLRASSFSRKGILTIAEHVVDGTPISHDEVAAIAADTWGIMKLDSGLDVGTLLTHVKGSTLILPRGEAMEVGRADAIVKALEFVDVRGEGDASTTAPEKATVLHVDEGVECRAVLKNDGERNALHLQFGKGLGISVREALKFLHLLGKYSSHELAYYVGDLHSHSTLSDGMFNPEDVGIAAFNCFMDFFGLTDHHTIAGSDYLLRASKERGWGVAIIPGCQEVTQLNAHHIAVCARQSIFELVEPEGILAEYDKSGARLKIFAHARQPHPWNESLIQLGSKSGFDSFVCRSEHLAHLDRYRKENIEPAWTESTDADDGCFGSSCRTVVFVEEKAPLMTDICDAVCNAIKWKDCVGISGLGVFGSPALVQLARLIPSLAITRRIFAGRFVNRVRGFLRDRSLDPMGL
ncbi:MAG: hypothetical protein JW839_22395 [Candidatus Lokiarchaeota archaeon]|nr:hypothetical protein [Candidatus Lokiarchaeota archaeon]